jgi:heat shock protein HtpX
VLASGADFYSRAARNRRHSFVFLGLFCALFLGFGLGLDVLWLGFMLPEGAPVPLLTLGATAVALVTGLSGYFVGARLVMASLHAQPLDPGNAEHRQLHNIVSEIALASGLPRPQVFVIPDSAPNALAAGRDPEHAILGVTRGLLNLLDREETQGVVAHEMAHIGNRDTLTMTLVAVLLGSMVLLSDWARRSLYFGGRKRRSNLLLFAIVLFLAALGPLLSRLMAMAVSRQLELLADATAARFTRNPLGLASALEKIAASSSPLRRATRGTAHLFFANPWPHRLDEHEGRLADFFSTHPPIHRRIAILRAMAGAG